MAVYLTPGAARGNRIPHHTYAPLLDPVELTEYRIRQSMFRRASTRSTVSRLHVVAIACACLLGQVSALAHRVLVQHATCSEHGESVHVRALGAAMGATTTVAVAPRPAADAQSISLTRAVTGAVAVVSDAHDHCSLVGSRSSTPQPQPDCVPASDPLVVRAGEPRDATLGPAIPNYLIAPKTSPPRLPTQSLS